MYLGPPRKNLKPIGAVRHFSTETFFLSFYVCDTLHQIALNPRPLGKVALLHPLHYFYELFPLFSHTLCQDSRRPLAQDGSVEDRGWFHEASRMYLVH